MAAPLGSQSTDDDEGIVDINTTPLIDVMLVLLIMLIITIPLKTESVGLDLPQGNPPPPIHPPAVATVAIGYDDAITWNGEAVPDEAQLVARLREAAATQGTADPVELHLQPDRLAGYKTVAHVLADAQRLGVNRIGIIGLEQFMPDNAKNGQ
ncbi:biopolymer transporter ExbD [Formicincola oecophyllae]|uniref:Biopolymer transporter ExbD n=1 Tax=Formicincola oecophyllae TaxID=2558361 RepID=A0A4Y6U9U2_9PROT|nr:biopolymer transporter ExbD [Formicincola oecophyllae]QDH13338.1 biopolymer transporter ExbD [Formicincola oecophyllae]